jgi:hypothetical protein
LAATVEAITGLALMVQPSWVSRLLLGADISGAGVVLSRLAGVALLSLGVACWPREVISSAPLRGMLTYNFLSTAYLAYLRFGTGWVGKLLLPAVVLHALLTLFLARAWYKNGEHQRSRMVGKETT